MGTRVVFLDRDGTINVDHGYVHRAGDWQFTARAVEALWQLRTAGYALAVVTNQSGIARGFYRLDDVHALHQEVQRQLAPLGVFLDAIALCPHGDTTPCDCRKPRTGMVRQVEAQLASSIDYSASWTVGDKISDVEFGWNLGTHTALIRGPYWQPAELPARPDLIVDSLYDAACRIVAASSAPPPAPAVPPASAVPPAPEADTAEG